MGAVDESLEFGHAGGYVLGKVGVYVVVVGDGVRTAGVAFDHVGIVAGNTVGSVIGVVGVFDHAGIPYVGRSERSDVAKNAFSDGVEFAGAVLFESAVVDWCRTIVCV